MKYIVVLLLSAAIASAQQNLLNGNFEDTTITHSNQEADTNARHWTMETFGAGITDDAYSGNSAAYIWNWYYYVPGELTNGDALFPNQGGTAINFSPNRLTGFYKYIAGEVDTENDSAVAVVCLTRYNTVTSRRDTIGYGRKKLGFISGYTAFSVDINYSNTATPDTAVVKFSSSENGFCTFNNCLYLYLDDVALSDTETGVRDAIKLEERLFVFPNPASNQLQIQEEILRNEKVVLTIYNALGEVVLEQMLPPQQSMIDISALPAGVYVARTENAAGWFVKE